MKFRIIGMMKIKDKEQKFSKIIEAENEKFALHKLYSIMGNAHGLRRRDIKIEKVEKM
ncbi:MAG: 50S ribosomal protein L18Ae [Candidatus Micrarchaeota archaeon]|nr:50S ribosomal protein L18Ae [Candidatus Micrarchaeota archaeon]